MIAIKSLLICSLFNLFIIIKAQEPITNAQRIFEFINYGPLLLLYGVLPSTISVLNITEKCSLSFNHTIDELHKGALWSNLMISSNGKELKNLLEGSFLNLGSYDKCLSIISSKMNETSGENSNNSTNTQTKFYGKYCLLDIVPHESLLTSSANGSLKRSEFKDSSLNVSQKLDVLFRFSDQLHPKIGFCLPSFCTDEDANALVNSVLDEYFWRLLSPLHCQTREALTFKASFTRSRVETKISFVILFILLTCVLSCTVLHIVLVKFEGLTNDLIKCFSLKNHISKLLVPTSQHLVLHTIQSLVMLICVISHTYLYFIWLDAYPVYDKIYDHLFKVKNIFYQPFVNIFDINTGLLFLIPSTFACIKLFAIENINFVKCIKVIASHFFKYLPIMIVLVAIQLVLPLLISGPIAHQFFARDAEYCSQSWYRNLLFVNNLNDYDRQCVLHSWIISTEMQFYVLLTFLVMAYSKMPSLAKVLNLLIIFSSIIIILFTVYLNTLSPAFIQMPLNLNALKIRAKLIHFASYSHLFEYFLPVFVFDLIYNKKITRIQVTTRKVLLNSFILAFLLIQFYSAPFNSLDYSGSRILNSFVIIFCKLTLPVFFVWMIYNYYEFSLEEIFEEIGFLCHKAFTDTSHHTRRNRSNSERVNGLKTSDLEMVTHPNEEEKLMNNKNDLNSRLMNSDLVNRLLSHKLLNDTFFNQNSMNEKLVIEMQEKSIQDKLMQDKLVQDKLIKIKLNELFPQLILSDHYYTQFNLIEPLNQNDEKLKEQFNHEKSISNQSKSFLMNLFLVYTRLAQSIYYSHHFYLCYDLYSIRSPLSTDLYDSVARFIYNLFYIHLIAILFYLFIEQPLCSLTKMIYTKLLKVYNF